VTERDHWPELEGYLRALRTKVTREHRSATVSEMQRLRALWEAADREYQVIRTKYPEDPFDPIGISWAEPPSWDLLVVELAPGEPEPERKTAGRHGKEYPGDSVEEVVRRATAARAEGRKLARTLRNELVAQVDDATAYSVDTIFRLMKRNVLEDAGRRGWLKIAGQFSTTPRFINLHELELRS
jgi:hypothetical protein